MARSRGTSLDLKKEVHSTTIERARFSGLLHGILAEAHLQVAILVTCASVSRTPRRIVLHTIRVRTDQVAPRERRFMFRAAEGERPQCAALRSLAITAPDGSVCPECVIRDHAAEPPGRVGQERGIPLAQNLPIGGEDAWRWVFARRLKY
jgi:hypothetical protein